MTNLSTLWTQDIKSQEDKDHFTKTILNATNDVVLMKLKKIIKAKRQSLEQSERDVTIYEWAAWPYMQADNNGSMRSLKLIEQLLAFVKD